MSQSTRQTTAVRRLIVSAVCIAILGTVVVLQIRGRHQEPPSQRQEKPPHSQSPVFVAQPATLAPGIHLLGELAPSVAYVVETTDGLILIDTGLESDCATLLRQFKQLKLDVNQLKMILITHAHGDHYLGAMHLRDLTGAKVYAGRDDASVMRSGGPRDAVFSTFDMAAFEIHPTDVDVELAGGETIELGGTRIRVLATPGHTPGSVCYVIRRDDRSILFSGDTIMSITGDLGTYAAYLPPRYRGDARAHLESFQTLERLGLPQLLLPGHPFTKPGSISATLSQGEWQTLLNRGMNDMHELVKRYEADGADFLDGAPKQLLPGLYYAGNHSEVAVYCLTTETGLHVFTTKADDGFGEFLEQSAGAFQLETSAITSIVMPACDTQSIHGLRQITESTKCRVAVPGHLVEQVREACPGVVVLTVETDMNQVDAIFTQTIPIEGFARSQVACSFEWRGKRVVITGDVPVGLAGASRVPTTRAVNAAMRSLNRLAKIKPDLWLPSVPVNGQNANLYGNEWDDTISANRPNVPAVR